MFSGVSYKENHSLHLNLQKHSTAYNSQKQQYRVSCDSHKMAAGKRQCNRLPGSVRRRTVTAIGGRQQTAVGTVGGAVGVGGRAVGVARVAIVTNATRAARVRIGGGPNGRRRTVTYGRDGLFTPGGVMIRSRHYLGLHLIFSFCLTV